MDPAILQQIMGGATQMEEQRQRDQELADLIARRKQASAQPYSSPTGQLLGSIGDIIMGRKESGLRQQHLDLANQIAGKRAQWGGDFMEAQQPVQAPPDMLAAPGFDQAAQEKQRQQKLAGLKMQGMLSGDPLISGYLQHAPGMELQDMNLQKAREEMAAKNSPAAGIATRTLMKKFGFDLPEGTPPATLEHLLPTAEKGYAADQTAQTRREAAQQSADLRKAMLQLQGQRFEVTSGLREDQFKTKRLKELTDAINPLLPKSGLKNYSDTINRAQKLAAIIDKPVDGKLTPQDMYEATIALQQMVAQGHASQSEVEHLAPAGLSADAARAMQYFTSKPWDAGQQAWASRILHSAQREADVNRSSILQNLKQKIPQFGDVRQKYAPDYESILKGAGLNPGAFNDQGLPVDGVEMLLGTNPVLGGAIGAGAGHGAGEMVPVISPEGKAGKIPAAKLDAALKRGFKRAGP